MSTVQKFGDACLVGAAVRTSTNLNIARSRGNDIFSTLCCSNRQIFLILPSISLSLPTPHTLGRQSLVTKGRPGPTVFVSPAPLDFGVRVHYMPDGHIARRTYPLILEGYNVGRCFFGGRCGGGTTAGLAAHDAVFLAVDGFAARGRVNGLLGVDAFYWRVCSAVCRFNKSNDDRT